MLCEEEWGCWRRTRIWGKRDQGRGKNCQSIRGAGVLPFIVWRVQCAPIYTCYASCWSLDLMYSPIFGTPSRPPLCHVYYCLHRCIRAVICDWCWWRPPGVSGRTPRRILSSLAGGGVRLHQLLLRRVQSQHASWGTCIRAGAGTQPQWR